MMRDKNRGAESCWYLATPTRRVSSSVMSQLQHPSNRAHPSPQFGVSWLISQDNALWKRRKCSRDGVDKNHAKLLWPLLERREVRCDAFWYFLCVCSLVRCLFSWTLKSLVTFIRLDPSLVFIVFLCSLFLFNVDS